ncbi:putative phosphoadenosine phosphosulfate reductase [Chloropicon primus]|uniref:FAD synthase n=1 Tax=Chloropicon primus TaxID=1764295 RepID=A0A5B8MG78_9CHLO|nr:putative phosphoadenosine phosphosulfate reductase [Chloropicon primus]|eukprot:QDZ19456.1 putative phosphoadenosine phosphosulfate reductase [Chloropicon primus]
MEVVRAWRGLREDDPLKEKVGTAIQRARRAVALYRDEELALSFNGGKDSTVVLHILRAAHALECGGSENENENENEASRGVGWLSFFFPSPDDFEDITAFVRDASEDLGLGVKWMDGSFKDGLDTLVRGGVRAIVIGTRQSDPNAKGQDVFCPSSEGWPPFMRVNPILDWTYADVWSFLLLIKAKYCVLYDQGYTSLGGKKDTKKNDLLLDQEQGTYKPAYTLTQEDEERAGRA